MTEQNNTAVLCTVYVIVLAGLCLVSSTDKQMIYVECTDVSMLGQELFGKWKI